LIDFSSVARPVITVEPVSHNVHQPVVADDGLCNVVAQGWTDPLEQMLARCGDADAPVRAVQQPHVKLILSPRTTWLTAEELTLRSAASLAKAPMPRDGQKRLQRGKSGSGIDESIVRIMEGCPD
jgi:hypothetical protein